MYSESEHKSLAKKAIAFAEGYECEVLVSSSDDALTRYGENVITQNVAGSDIGLSIRVLKNNRMGKASTGNLSDEGIKKCVDVAIAALKVSEPDEDILPLIHQQQYTQKETFFKETHELSPEARAEGVGKAVAACKSRNLQAAGIYENSGSAFGIANSNNLWAFRKSSSSTLSLSAMSKDSSGWAEDTDPQCSNLQVDRIIEKAIRTAINGQAPVEIQPGAYTVIFEPAAVADFLLFLGWEAFNGLAFVEGRSCFSDKVGQKVVGENITLTDDFLHPMTPGSPFDFEGSARKQVTMIENGVFRSTVHDRKTAKLTGMEPTGHAMPQPDAWGPSPLNIVMSPGDTSQEEMIASTENGLLVTRLHYTNILNPVTMMLTGMTRDGFFKIENGKITKGLKNMRFTDSVLQILSNVEALSRDLHKTGTFWGGGGTVAPAIKVNNFHFTSKTEN